MSARVLKMFVEVLISCKHGRQAGRDCLDFRRRLGQRQEMSVQPHLDTIPPGPLRTGLKYSYISMFRK